MEKRKVALVIGAGSVKCAAALGALRVLKEEDISIDLVVGASGGALYAAAIALGWTPETTASLTRRFWTPELTGRRNNRALLQALLPGRFRFDGRFGLRDDAPLRRRLEELFGARTFAQTEIPLFITATDFLTGEQVILRHGPLNAALRASLAIPFIFAPWPVDGRLLVDGYLSDPLPGNVAIQEGADVIIAIGFESPRQQKINSPLRHALQLSSIMTNSMFRSRVAFQTVTHHAETLLLTPQLRRRIDPFDGEQAPAIIAAGEEAMTAQLPSLKATLNSDSTALSVRAAQKRALDGAPGE